VAMTGTLKKEVVFGEGGGEIWAGGARGTGGKVKLARKKGGGIANWENRKAIRRARG